MSCSVALEYNKLAQAVYGLFKPKLYVLFACRTYSKLPSFCSLRYKARQPDVRNVIIMKLCSIAPVDEVRSVDVDV